MGEKSLLEYHGMYCCRKDPPKNAKNNERNFKDKRDLCIASKYLPQNGYFCSSFNRHLEFFDIPFFRNQR